MRECSEYCELISCLIDGELSDDERRETLAHIEQCPECRQVYEAFTELSTALREDAVEPPIELYDSVMSRLNSQRITHVHRYRARVITWASAAAACVAVGFVVLGVTGNLGNMGARAKESAAAAPQSVFTMQSAADTGAGKSEPEISGDNEAVYAYTVPEEAAEPLPEPEAEKADAFDIEAPAAPVEDEATAAGVPDTILAPSGELGSAEPAGSNELLGMLSVAAGRGGLYYGLTEALFWQAGAEQALIVDDWDALLKLTDLIIWGGDYEGDAPDTEPEYTLELYDEYGYMCTVSIWSIDGALLCQSDADLYFYTAVGSLSELLELLDA